jgi:protein-L-isoaspartate(D-aspartate) O-methyltransferase
VEQTAVDETTAEALRHAMVDAVLERYPGTIAGDVERALRTVPRHRFAPEADLTAAYADDVIRTRFDATGATTSSVSAPWLQARMLALAQIQPGMNVLEIGSGGYNAALIAELVGAHGRVTTMDIDPVVTARARGFLDAAGYPWVRVLLGDAAAGVTEHAPYDRILVTVGMHEPAASWISQLAPDGRGQLRLSRLSGSERRHLGVRRPRPWTRR